MSGLLLHLSGPLQSWGTRSDWNVRDTLSYPSRSGLVGMLAAALGHKRHEPLTRYAALEFAIRIDRPGQIIVDFQTVGGGRPREESPLLANGQHRPAGKGTIVSERYYLSDAAFTVAVMHDSEELIDELETALSAPKYGVHLGRRSCPPAAPLVVGRSDDPVAELLYRVPIAREKPHGDDHVAVELVAERPPPGGGPSRSETATTRPISFAGPRAHEPHTTWRTTHLIPIELCGGIGSSYVDALIDYRYLTS
ncbi:type I-E CRISPR-associated protein Cas5/CasD [Nocardia sp. NPDC088792]|uniref:type I-E CRISPR-associated protein Cas5/CasD n=1 Tax=Nocardia sp. NPDC088792 TaxID=3364332 RepID=UPI0037F5E8FC